MFNNDIDWKDLFRNVSTLIETRELFLIYYSVTFSEYSKNKYINDYQSRLLGMINNIINYATYKLDTYNYSLKHDCVHKMFFWHTDEVSSIPDDVEKLFHKLSVIGYNLHDAVKYRPRFRI